jgi:hypothetical protein
MGRPLHAKYFGNTTSPFENWAQGGTTGVGGESVASVTISGTWANFADATTTVTFTAPQIAGGITATGTATIVAGAVTAVIITNPGSGYTSAPTVTIADSDGGAETTGTATAVLTSTRPNAIIPQVRIGSTNRTSGNDILKQVSAKRFRVRSQDGTAICKLVAGTPGAAGEMAIVATDASSGTYWVSKISGRKVTLVQNTGSVYTNGSSVPWTLGNASATVAKLNNA